MTSEVFHISGMQCGVCTLLVERELKTLPGVERVRADLARQQVSLDGEFDRLSRDELLALIHEKLVRHGYTPFHEAPPPQPAWRDFIWALPLALLFLGGFFWLQRQGIVDWLEVRNITYPAAFLIGVIASLSTCMAAVGGLTLSLSASYVQQGQRFLPLSLFHAGRLLAFFAGGGLIGWLGQGLHFSPAFSQVAGFGLSLLVLMLGLSLLGIWRMPPFVSRRLLAVEGTNHTLMPVLLGVATFLLPCGFTQTMQAVALAGGSFWQGAFSLLAFALGTLPVLAVLSFAPLGLQSHRMASIFFKTAGLVAIAFAVFSLFGGLNAAQTANPPARQKAEILVHDGYQPDELHLKAQTPATLRFVTRNTYDCSGSVVIAALGYSEHLPLNGVSEVAIPAQPAGTRITGACSMGMFHFALVFD